MKIYGDQKDPMSILAWLDGDFQEPVRDPLWGNILMSEEFDRIRATSAFQKLGRIKQLGPAHLTYPGAVHTRLNHSLGVYHIARLIVGSLLRHSIKDSTENILTIGGISAFLAAALLHDLGHFPYAHSLKELPLHEHEFLGTQIIRGDKELHDALGTAGISIEDVCAIIDGRQPTASDEILFYRALLSGTLDPDKLDYLNRDAFFCGVPYGSQDTSYIIDKIHIHDGMPAVPERAAGSIEHLLFSKYQMYRNVYWHKRNRAATAMIKEAVITAMNDSALQAEDLYDLDDEQFSFLPSSFSHDALQLISLVRDNKLYSACYDKPFDAEKPGHQESIKLSDREKVKGRLYALLSKKTPSLAPWDVIIDIPEPLSFEVDIPLISEDGSVIPFSSTSGIFDRSATDGPARLLRHVRVFVPRGQEDMYSKTVEKLLDS